MDTNVFLAVIFAAFLHALWNSIIKFHKDKYLAIAAIVLGHVPLSLIAILFWPIMSTGSLLKNWNGVTTFFIIGMCIFLSQIKQKNL